MIRKPRTDDLFRDAQRRSTSGKQTTAKCGHPGEHVIGQFVRCLYGCDGEAVKDPPVARTKKTCKADCHYWYKKRTLSLLSWTDPRTGRQIISCAECGDILERK